MNYIHLAYGDLVLPALLVVMDGALSLALRLKLEKQLAIATVMTVTLSCDHRVVDGATGAKFLSAFKAMIEDPATMLV